EESRLLSFQYRLESLVGVVYSILHVLDAESRGFPHLPDLPRTVNRGAVVSELEIAAILHHSLAYFNTTWNAPKGIGHDHAMQGRRHNATTCTNLSDNGERIASWVDDFYRVRSLNERSESLDQFVILPVRNNSKIPLFLLWSNQFMRENSRVSESNVLSNTSWNVKSRIWSAHGENLHRIRVQVETRGLVQLARS